MNSVEWKKEDEPVVQRLDSSSLDSSQGMGVGSNGRQLDEDHSYQLVDPLYPKERLREEPCKVGSDETFAVPLPTAQLEINLNSFSKRVVQEWKDEYVGPKYYSISPVSSHENSVASEEGVESTETKRLDSCLDGFQNNWELCQEVSRNDDFFRLMAPSERIFRRAVLNYRTQRRHSLSDAILSHGFVSLLSKQERQYTHSEEGVLSHSKPLPEIPFWSNRCRRAVSLTLSHEDLLEDLECIGSTSHGGTSSFVEGSSWEGVSADKLGGRRNTRGSDASSAGFSREDNMKEDCIHSVRNSDHQEDRLSLKKRFREMFRASKHRGFICCVYCGAECWAPNGRYHFNSCKVYNSSRREQVMGGDVSQLSSQMKSGTQSDTSRSASQHMKKSRFRHWSEAARVEGFKKTLDRPGYVICLECGEHVWAPNSRRHASVCFLTTDEARPVAKRSRRECPEKQDDGETTKDSFSVIADCSKSDNLSTLEKCPNHGESESSLSKHEETEDMLFCAEQEGYSGEHSQVSHDVEWNSYSGGSEESKDQLSFCKVPKGESIACNFRRSASRKGWLECRYCEVLVWPPNASRHIRNCEK